MDLVIKQLETMKKGHATTMFGLVVIRIGDKYIVGVSPSIREDGKSLLEAAELIYKWNR